MRNKKHYCDDCGKLGDDVQGWPCNQEDDGKKTCDDCHRLRCNQKDLNEEKALRKKQQTDGFGEVPYKTYYYCAHDSKRLSTHVERIPVDGLKDYSTVCGTNPNAPFTSEVITFIKANSGKDFVVAEVYNGTKEIASLAVHWKGSEKTRLSHTDAFSDMISDNEGSLRADQCFEEGWDTYESE